MPLLVAAATDQTGRTILMLSVGLVAVAVGLALSTIWYWRFTSPRRRVVASDTAADRHSTEREPAIAVASPVASPVVEPPVAAPAVVEPPVVEPPVVASPAGDLSVVASPEVASSVVASPEVASPVAESPGVVSPVAEPVVDGSVVDRSFAADPVPRSADDAPPSLGFDDDQWAMITQAVLDEYRES